MEVCVIKTYHLTLTEYEMTVIKDSLKIRIFNLDKTQNDKDMLCPHRLAKIEAEEILRNIIDGERGA